MIRLRRPQGIPQHVDALDTISTGHHRVQLRHPAYPEGSNILLILPANDHPDGGIHHETARLACAIVAGNSWDGWLSESRKAEPLGAGPEEVLRKRNYYFHARPYADAPFKYPIVPTFAHWRFPHDKLPPYWEATIEHTTKSVSTLRSNTSAALTLRDQTCRMSDHQEGCEMAHICPRSEDIWFHENEMWRYALDAQKTGTAAIDDLSNLVLLRSDLHKSFDKLKFVWVPKVGDAQAEFATHGLAESAELARLYQNARLHAIPSVSREFLFARFAFSIFPLIQGFLQRGVEREVLVVAEDQTLVSRAASADVCRGWTLGTLRPRSASPKKRARPTEESYGDGALEEVARRKRARPTYKMSHSVVDANADCSEVPSLLALSASTEHNLDPLSDGEGQRSGIGNAGRVRRELVDRFLKEQRERSDPEGLWAKELEWRQGAIGRVLELHEIPRLYSTYGVDCIADVEDGENDSAD